MLLVKRFIPSLIDLLSTISPTVKLKLFITFFQVIASLQGIYGVIISSRQKDWKNVFKWFSSDYLQIARVPILIQCIGSTIQQLLITSLRPFLITSLRPFMLSSFVVVVISLFYLLQTYCQTCLMDKVKFMK